MTTPASILEALQQNVAQPKAEATSREEYKQPPPKVPLKGRAIFFKGDGKLADGPFIHVVLGDPAREPKVRQVLEKLVATTAGLWLVDTMSDMLYDRKTGKYTTKIHLLFIGDAVSGVDTECGSINRGDDAPEYWVSLKSYAYQGEALVTAAPGVEGIVRCGTRYPPFAPDAPWVLNVCFEDSETDMGVECVYHELTHIWFIKGGAKRERLKKGLPAVTPTWPTGHGTYANGEYEPDFHDMMTKIVNELNQPHAAALAAYKAFLNQP